MPDQYQLEITATARRDFRRLPAQVKERTIHAIDELANQPRPSGCSRLRGRDAYRIRVGDYRVLYEVNDRRALVTVLRIKHRKDAYRGL